MNFSTLKKPLYRIKDAYKCTFLYPTDYIETYTASDYNIYWKSKRGAAIGTLSEWQKDRADIILGVLKENYEEHITLTDVGCGDGSILSYLRKNKNSIGTCIGYDSSQYALEKARELGIETHHFDISDRDNYSMLSKTDYYLLLEVLEHIPNSEELLLYILTQSNKGVFFSFPNTGYLTHRLRILFGKFPLQWRIFPNEHVRFWTYTDLKWWLKALNITEYTIHCYKGVPILNKIFPGLFAAGFVIYVPKNE